MKKWMTLLLTAAMMLSMAACGETGDTTSSEVSSEEKPVNVDLSLMSQIPDIDPGATTFDVAFTDPLPAGESKVTDVDGDGVIRVACVGDSITQGNEGSNWPEFLQEYLNYLSTIDGKQYEVKNCGKAGAAVHHVLEETDGNEDGTIDPSGEYFFYDSPRYVESLSYPADLVIVQHGANDGLGGNAAQLTEYFVNDYTNYLIKPYTDKGAKVVVATPTYASNGYVDYYVNGWISEAVRKMADTYGLQCVDMNKITQPRRESFPDGIHGNVSGYKLIAQTYMNQIFGMELATVTFKTEPGTAVEMGIHMTTVHSQGVGTIQLLKGLETGATFDLKLSCTDFKPFNGTITVEGTVEQEYSLTPGAYNIAKGAAASASSENSNDGGNVAGRGVDGDQNTRWESNYGDNAWFIVDLGESHLINGVNIYWEGAYASRYVLEISSDGNSYTQVAEVNISKEGLEATAFDEVDARYVRMRCLQRATGFGVSFYEMQVLSDIR